MAPYWALATLFLSGLLLILTCVQADDVFIAEDEVDIRPGSERQEYEMTLADATCKFTYKAQGGTNEKWKMGLIRNPQSTEFVCTIQRENGLSYLFFEEFKLQVLNDFYGKEFTVLGDNHNSLDEREYKKNRQEAHVSHSKKFQSKLSVIELKVGRKSENDEL